jgi:hypothetical protein
MNNSTRKIYSPPNGQFVRRVTTTKALTWGLFAVAAFLMISPLVIQTVNAQNEATRFLIRVIQGTAQAGLVNVSVNLGGVIVNDVIDVTRNNIAVPITIPVAANVGVVANVCATVLSTGDVVCTTVSDLEQRAMNQVTLNLDQAP